MADRHQYWTMFASCAQSIFGLYSVWFLFIDNFGVYHHFYEFDSKSSDRPISVIDRLEMAWYGMLAALIAAPVQVCPISDTVSQLTCRCSTWKEHIDC